MRRVLALIPVLLACAGPAAAQDVLTHSGPWQHNSNWSALVRPSRTTTTEVPVGKTTVTGAGSTTGPLTVAGTVTGVSLTAVSSLTVTLEIGRAHV